MPTLIPLSLLNLLLAIMIGHCRQFPLAFSTPEARVTTNKTTLSLDFPFIVSAAPPSLIMLGIVRCLLIKIIKRQMLLH